MDDSKIICSLQLTLATDTSEGMDGDTTFKLDMDDKGITKAQFLEWFFLNVTNLYNLHGKFINNRYTNIYQQLFIYYRLTDDDYPEERTEPALTEVTLLAILDMVEIVNVIRE